MSIAKSFLSQHAYAEAAASAVNVQFFTRSTIMKFSDGSTLYIQMYGLSYATDALEMKP